MRINNSTEDILYSHLGQAVGCQLVAAMGIVVLLLLFSSCENPNLEAAEGDTVNLVGDGGCKVEFRMSDLHIDAYEGEAATIAEQQQCGRLNFAIFKDDERLKVVNQTADQPNFGRVLRDIEPGVYRIVVLGHNGLGNASISSPEKIKFKDNKVTDTFYYYGTIEVVGTSSFDIPLKRAVAKCQIVVRDRIPSTVSQMQFKYTGGSSTFDAVSGYGCVNSRQTENRVIHAPDEYGTTKFDLYTFPHQPKDLLSITVMALNSSGDILSSHVINDVEVNINKLTSCEGKLFESTSEGSSDGDFMVTTRDEWLE